MLRSLVMTRAVLECTHEACGKRHAAVMQACRRHALLQASDAGQRGDQSAAVVHQADQLAVLLDHVKLAAVGRCPDGCFARQAAGEVGKQVAAEQQGDNEQLPAGRRGAVVGGGGYRMCHDVLLFFVSCACRRQAIVLRFVELQFAQRVARLALGCLPR
jgi:hypothetical protein